MTWTTAQEDRLRVLIAEGCTSAQVAAVLNNEFGTTYERNAVIGKRHRLGILSIRKPGPVKRAVHLPGRVSARSGQWTGMTPSAPVPVPEVPPEPTSENCSLLELTSVTCRWPVGDLYCGAATDQKSSYCPYHTALSIRKRV